MADTIPTKRIGNVIQVQPNSGGVYIFTDCAELFYAKYTGYAFSKWEAVELPPKWTEEELHRGDNLTEEGKLQFATDVAQDIIKEARLKK